MCSPRLRRIASALVFSGSLAACGADDAPSTGLDHTRVFEQKTHSIHRADTPFSYEVPTLFRTPEVLPELDVRALLVVDDRLHAGTSSSVLVFDRDAERFVPHADPRARGLAVVDLAARGSDMVVASARELRVLGPTPASWTSTAGAVRAVTTRGSEIWFGTSEALWRWSPPANPIRVMAVRELRDLAALGDTVYVATAAGVERVGPAGPQPPWRAPAMLVDDDVRALGVSSDARTLLAASAGGYASITDGVATLVRPMRGGLPTDDLTAIVERDGLILTGHAVGATAIGPGPHRSTLDHYHTERWIPDERVQAVAIGEGGTRWIATARGVSRIGFATTTLAQRAARFEALLPAKHWRMDGFIDDDVNLANAWDPDSGFFHDDKDNDGLWTQMQIGPWCLAYSVTKDERYYQEARRALDVMFMLIDVPALTFEAQGMKRGFVARSLVRDDEGVVFEEKRTSDRWVAQRYEGRDYFWKNDTSSDEYAGHFFGYPLFYDLCAKDDAERAAIAEHMRVAADYIIEGDYLLRDLDGEGTTYGRWKDLAAGFVAPNDCASQYPLELCISSLGGGGWLNGMEILGHLLATWHVTGDQKYYDAYEYLYVDKRYGELIPVRESTATVTDPAIANHSDHELALLAYFTLLRYEPNEGRRARLMKSILDFQEYERRERNPWSVSVVASGVELTDAQDPGVDDALDTLRVWPEDLRAWPHDNSHRKDAGRWPNDRHRREQFDVVFPYDEIKTMKWNTSPYSVVDGRSGKNLLAPTPWLIAYWKLRYYGVLD